MRILKATELLLNPQNEVTARYSAFFDQIGGGQNGSRVDIQHAGELLDLLDGRPLNATLQAAQVGSATDVGKSLPG